MPRLEFRGKFLEVKMPKDLTAGIPKHLIGEHYVMPDAPPFGADKENEYIARLKKAREAVISFLPFSIGQKIHFENKDNEIVVAQEGGIESTITGIIVGPNKNHVNHFSYVLSYKEKTEKKTEILVMALPQEIQMDRGYAKAMATYENERHSFVTKYAFVAQKTASEYYKQCHRGMGFDDLCQAGFAAILNVADRWPPFLGSKDTGTRILTSIKTSVRNAMMRCLDDFNRTVKTPSYKIEQVTVCLKADNILLGKRKKKEEHNCQENQCKGCSCANLYSKGCRRSKPGQFEIAIQNLLKSVYDIKGTKEEQRKLLEDAAMEIDGKSLRDFAIETGRYHEVAEVVNLDIGSVISMTESTISIDMPVDSSGEDTIADMISQEEYDGDYRIFQRKSLEEALEYIAPRNAEIIRDHYFGQMSIREIAKKYGFSTVRANDLLKRSINQIKSSNEAMNILIHKVVGRQ